MLYNVGVLLVDICLFFLAGRKEEASEADWGAEGVCGEVRCNIFFSGAEIATKHIGTLSHMCWQRHSRRAPSCTCGLEWQNKRRPGKDEVSRVPYAEHGKFMLEGGRRGVGSCHRSHGKGAHPRAYLVAPYRMTLQYSHCNTLQDSTLPSQSVGAPSALCDTRPRPGCPSTCSHSAPVYKQAHKNFAILSQQVFCATICKVLRRGLELPKITLVNRRCHSNCEVLIFEGAHMFRTGGDAAFFVRISITCLDAWVGKALCGYILRRAVSFAKPWGRQQTGLGKEEPGCACWKIKTVDWNPNQCLCMDCL